MRKMWLIQWLKALQGFNPNALSCPCWWLLAAGFLTAFAFEPVGWDIGALAPAFWLLLRLSEDIPLKSVFYRGWVFGVGHYMGGLYWIALSLTVDFKQFFWLFPLAMGAIPAILALLSGACLWVTCRLGLKDWNKSLTFCVLWCAGEWLRGHWMGGFPWNLMGYVCASSTPLLQTASVIGVYGLSLLTLIMAVFAFHRRGIWLTALLWVGLWGYGHYRLHQPLNHVKGVWLRLVQPSIKQELKWKPHERQRILAKLYSLSNRPSLKSPTHIIWPESAAVFDVIYDRTTLGQMAKELAGQGKLIFGAPHISRNPQGHMEKIWNSIFAWSPHEGLQLVYDKVHLVPFGEYLPFRDFLPSFFEKVTPGTLDYERGSGLLTYIMKDIPPFSPTICYEIIFPGQVMAPTLPRAEWILNVTNDGWFGRSSGPYQHLAMAQMRAVETGLPIVRSANNGISAIIDPYGRLLHRLGLNEEGIIDGPLPQAFASTPYLRWGDAFFFGMMGILCLIIGFNLYRQYFYRRKLEHLCI